MLQLFSGRSYWYNLHVVIVNDEHWMEVRHEALNALSDMTERAATNHGHRLSRVGLLADHVHLTLRVGIDETPEEVVLGYLNHCAYACGMKPLFKFSYYLGTFGECDRGAV